MDIFDQAANSGATSVAPSTSGDIFDQAASSATTPHASTSTHADIFDHAASLSDTPSAAPTQPGDIFDQAAGTSTSAQSTPSNADQPWYSRAWDWLNTPTVDLKRQGATGIEAGAEDFASGFTSPLSVGLALATLGTAPLLESIGLDLAKMAAPEVLGAAKTVGKLASAGFTAVQLKGIADESPHFVQAVKSGDTQKALEIGTNMLLTGGLAGLGAAHTAKEFGWLPDDAELQHTSADKLVGTYQRMLKEDDVQARTFNKEFKQAVPDVSTRGAIQLYAEAGGDTTTLADWQQKIAASDTVKPALKTQVLDVLKKAQSLSPDEVAQVDKLKQWYDTDFEEAVGHDLLSTESKKTNYVARARWQGEEDSPVEDAKVALGESNQPDHTRRRIYETTVDGLLNGEEPVKNGSRYVFDASDTAADYHRAIGKEVARSEFVNNAMRMKAEDGRPFAVPSGTGQTLENSGTVIANSFAIPDHPLTKAGIASLKAGWANRADLQGMIDDRKIIDIGDGKYRYDTSGYEQVQSPHTNKYSYAGPDTLVKAPVAFHPDILDQSKAILAPERSAIRDIPGVNKALELSSFAKHTLLGGSGFHWLQEGLRGIQSGVNPFNLEDWDMTNPQHVRLIEAGGIQPGIEGAGNAFTEGVEGHGGIAKVPGVGDVLNKLNQNLFGSGGFIDKLKLTSALKFADRLKDTNPEMYTMTRYKVAGQMANARYGGLNYLSMGRSKTAQDIMRLTLLAPDWLESQAKDLGFAAKFPKIGGADLARIGMYNFMAARALNYAVSGSAHMEEPFGVVSSDGKKVYSVRTMPSDLWHAATNPRDFAFNRLNPVFSRTGLELGTGRDKMGHERNLGEQMVDLFKNITPIPAQGVFDKMTGQEKPNESLSDSALSAMGATTKPNYSPAESLAYKLSSGRAASAEQPAETLERHHKIYDLEDRLRGGDTSAINEAKQLAAGGVLAPADVGKILKDSKVSRLESVTKGLPLSNALNVYDMATDQEKEQLRQILLRKVASYQKTERMKQTALERQRMDTRLAMFGAATGE